MDTKVFISYSHRDKRIADSICKALDELKIPYFRDIKEMEWGDNITRKVEFEINKCSHALIIISPSSKKSEWVPFEIGIARAKELTILPYLVHIDEEPFSFISGLLYKSKIKDVKIYFQKYKKIKSEQLIRNPKPVAIDDIIFNNVYLMFGNYLSPIEISARYIHDELKIPKEIIYDYNYLAAQAEKKANELGAQYFNGPNVRLIRFTQENTRQGIDGQEIQGITLELGPVSWTEYTVLNTFFEYKLKSGLTIRETFTDPEKLYKNDRDFRWCKLSNILSFGMVPVTSDGYAILQVRNPKGVSIHGGRLTSGVAENIHRYLDESSVEDLTIRINPIGLPKEIHKNGIVDENYVPRGVPSPYLAAQRGIWEEISEELSKLISWDSYKFLFLAFDLINFVPILNGIIELGISKKEVEKIRIDSPGRDHAEYIDILYVPLDLNELETYKIITSTERWVPNGLASFIAVNHYWRSKTLK